MSFLTLDCIYSQLEPLKHLSWELFGHIYFIFLFSYLRCAYWRTISLSSQNEYIKRKKKDKKDKKSLKTVSWWRHELETLSALVALCGGIHRSLVNSPTKAQLCSYEVSLMLAFKANCWVNSQMVISDAWRLIRGYPAKRALTAMLTHGR